MRYYHILVCAGIYNDRTSLVSTCAILELGWLLENFCFNGWFPHCISWPRCKRWLLPEIIYKHVCRISIEKDGNMSWIPFRVKANSTLSGIKLVSFWSITSLGRNHFKIDYFEVTLVYSLLVLLARGCQHISKQVYNGLTFLLILSKLSPSSILFIEMRYKTICTRTLSCRHFPSRKGNYASHWFSEFSERNWFL